MAIETLPQIDNVPAYIGINGFGRIGRAVFRACLARTDVHIRAINHTALSAEHLMTAIKYDTTHGMCPQASEISIAPFDHPEQLPVTATNPHPAALIFRGHLIHLLSQRDPANLDWKAAGVIYVAECTGKMTTRDKAQVHIKQGGAQKVLISAPSKDCPNVVFGVNHYDLEGSEDIISNASCTTNCLSPVALVLQRAFGIECGMMTTVHASTSSQKVLDGFSSKDVRSGRAVMGNIIPATTGAAQAVVKVLPELAGKFQGISIRVPISNVSLVDLTVTLETPVPSKEALVAPFRRAAGIRPGPLQSSEGPELGGILRVSDEKLVSSDYLSSSESAILDVDATTMLDERHFKVIVWYDNEWAFASRMCDLIRYWAEQDSA